MKRIPLLYEIYIILAILSLVGCATGYAQKTEESAPQHVGVKLLYATDREINDTTKPQEYYGSKL